MRPTRSYGRPGTRVLPTGWARSHQRVAEGVMTDARVALREPGGTRGAFNDTTGTYEDDTTNAPFATNVPAMIQALTETSVPAANAAGESVRVIGYRVSIPNKTPVTNLDEGILVDVTSCSGDPMLAGATLHVTDIVRGTHRFWRDLICDLNT